MDLLIDNSILALSIVASAKSIKLAGLTNTLAVFQARPKPERLKEIELLSLAKLAALAKDGTLRFWTCPELLYEAYRGRSFPSQNEMSILRGVERSYAKRPISDSAMRHFGAGKIPALVRHLCSLDKPDENYISRDNHIRLRQICRSLDIQKEPNPHLSDAFFLLTAEHNGLDYFLSTDKKFRNALRTNKHLDLKCQVATPSDLLERLGVFADVSLPVDFGKRYYLNGRPYD